VLKVAKKEISKKIQSQYIELLKKILPENQTWVVFSKGTFITFGALKEGIEQEALHYIRQKGRVIPGTPLADFNVESLPKNAGWIIHFYLEEMKTVVLHTEVEENERAAVQVGLYGRYKRDLDAKEPKIIHKNIGLNN
jgi:hypothetical protein